MRQFFLTAILCGIVASAFAQKQTENGKIYSEHPYIDAVNASVKAYQTKDVATRIRNYLQAPRSSGLQ